MGVEKVCELILCTFYIVVLAILLFCEKLQDIAPLNGSFFVHSMERMIELTHGDDSMRQLVTGLT